LWITDGNNARVLEYVSPFSNGMEASVALGQTTFQGMHMGTSANMLAEPYDVKTDANGNLWIADTANNRILEFGTISVPEFGPIVLVTLVIAIISIIFISAKGRLRSLKF